MNCSTACSPSLASATTVMSGCTPTMRAIPSRIKRWSSTQRTRIVAGMPVRSLSCSALIERNEPLGIRRAGVLRARADQTIVRVLLEDMSRPAGHAADGEDRRVEIDRNPERVVGGRRVEINVRIQLLVALDERFDPLRHVEPGSVAGPPAEVLGHAAQMCGAWVFRLVHAVPEAWNLFLAAQLAANHLVHPFAAGCLPQL